MDSATLVLLELFLVFVAAQVGAEVAQRLGLPAVVGEITAGCIIGASVLGWVKVDAPLEVLAEIGAVFLLFAVGLETRVDELKQVGRVATLVGISGVALPFVLGILWAVLIGNDIPRSMFVGAAFVATSAGITARVLQDLGVLQRTESRVILGAAVIDDILAMLLLGVVTSLQNGAEVNLVNLLVVFIQAVGFIAVIAVVGARIMRHTSPLLQAPINPLSPLTISLALCLGLAVAAAYLGLAAIIGAFLAGMIASETEHRETLTVQLRPISAFLVPFFFVVTGAKINLIELSSLSALSMLASVTLLALAGKFFGCGLAALSLGRQSATIVGVGMIPRGEVGIIVAGLGLHAGVLSDTLYAIIIAMSLLTSVLTPPVLKALFVKMRQESSAGSIHESA